MLEVMEGNFKIIKSEENQKGPSQFVPQILLEEMKVKGHRFGIKI